MAKNYMKEVANLLGVELHEDFKIKGKDFEDYVYMINYNYLMCRAYDKKEWFKSDMLVELLNGSFKIEKPILDQKEKEYLSVVIKPFRSKVNWIRMECNSEDDRYIAIDIEDDVRICFPNFKLNTMYKGMELEKEYTLEELGL